MLVDRRLLVRRWRAALTRSNIARGGCSARTTSPAVDAGGRASSGEFACLFLLTTLHVRNDLKERMYEPLYTRHPAGSLAHCDDFADEKGGWLCGVRMKGGQDQCQSVRAADQGTRSKTADADVAPWRSRRAPGRRPIGSRSCRTRNAVALGRSAKGTRDRCCFPCLRTDSPWMFVKPRPM